MRATQAYHKKILVIFDFDLTLAPGTLDAVLERCGQDPDAWRHEKVAALRSDGWEEILANVYLLRDLSQAGSPITRDMMQDAGRGLAPYEGVEEMFGELRQRARSVDRDLEVEFHLLSSGFLDVISATPIAGAFETLRGTELHFDEDGALSFPKLIITHPEKVRYILALAKGLDPNGPNAPAHVYQDRPGEERLAPLDQIVYVGDGRSDMSVFRLLHDNGGLAIGVFSSTADEWTMREETDTQRRVQNLARADFRPGSELRRSIGLAVDSVAHKAALRRLGKGE